MTVISFLLFRLGYACEKIYKVNKFSSKRVENFINIYIGKKNIEKLSNVNIKCIDELMFNRRKLETWILFGKGGIKLKWNFFLFSKKKRAFDEKSYLKRYFISIRDLYEWLPLLYLN